MTAGGPVPGLFLPASVFLRVEVLSLGHVTSRQNISAARGGERGRHRVAVLDFSRHPTTPPRGGNAQTPGHTPSCERTRALTLLRVLQGPDLGLGRGEEQRGHNGSSC